MLTAIARVVTEQPRRVLIGAVTFLVVAVTVGAPVTSKLSVDPDRDFIDPSSESTITSDRLSEALGRTLSPGVIVLVRSQAPVRSADGQAKLRRVVTRIDADPGVAQIVSAYGNRRGASPFISRDGRSTYVAVFVRDDADGEDVGERLGKALDREPGVLVGGLEVAGPAVGDQVSEDLARAEMLAFPLLFLLTLIVFRGAIAALLPLLVGLLTIMSTFLGLRLVNEATPLSIFALNLAIGLGLGLSIDYSLFVLSRYREEMQRLGPGRDALVRTLRTAGRTVIFSSLTVAAALLALLVFPQRFLYSMAISGAITAIGAGIISLTALPAVLMVLGERVNSLAPERWRYRETRTEHGFWYRLSHFVMRRPVAVAVTTAAVLLAAGIPFTRIEFTGVDASVLPGSSEPKMVDNALRTQFPPGRTSPLHVAVSAPRSQAREV
ncbi:MAG: MMPL family transporter, partial [Solirubrobacteraceae bacterium]